MKKKYLLALPFILVSSLANAGYNLGDTGVNINGWAEGDLFLRTNNTGLNGNTATRTFMEVTTVVNIDGRHETDLGFVVWRAASKLATDGRYDALGQREAWLGFETSNFGTLKVGNQYSNLYLTMDVTYGNKGLFHLYSDMGAHSTNYTRSINYISPKLAGLTLSLQYNLPAVVSAIYSTDTTATLPKDVSAYGYEALLKYNDYGVTVDLGYQNNVNGQLTPLADSFGKGSAKTGSADYADSREGDSNVMLVGLGYTIADVSLYASYKKNTWGLEIGDISTELSNDQFMVLASYKFLEKNTVSLGYNSFSEITSDVDSAVVAAAAQAVHFQYDRQIAENVSVFAQLRHTMYDVKDENYNTIIPVDGLDTTAKKDSADRVLLGVWLKY